MSNITEKIRKTLVAILENEAERSADRLKAAELLLRMDSPDDSWC